MKRTKHLALSAMLTALSVALVWSSTLIPTARVAVVAVCGIVTAVAVLQCGYFWAAGHFAVVSALALLLIPDYGVSMMYVVMLGWYPIVKSFFEMRFRTRRLQWLMKILVAAAAIGVWIGALRLLFTESVFRLYVELPWIPQLTGSWAVAALFVLMLAVFVIYDIALTRVIAWFIHRIPRR